MILGIDLEPNILQIFVFRVYVNGLTMPLLCQRSWEPPELLKYLGTYP